jgi:hypothetical protein
MDTVQQDNLEPYFQDAFSKAANHFEEMQTFYSSQIKEDNLKTLMESIFKKNFAI